jgi:arginase family enzyme
VDIVEVNPYLDHAELTQHMAVQLLLEAIASAFPIISSEKTIND